ncbi:hypothetical protein AB0K16_46915 [Nonomuraea jabiensis]|uniref:hypothetical protein n=1 Tax=Nonomuraea jabiensis TaxID=882448 RepID=UPI003431E79A
MVEPLPEAFASWVDRMAAADLRDLALVLARSGTDTGERVSLDEVLATFGHSRESLAAIPDDE